ncbi:MAG: chromate transporter [Lachnospiraceae bacterium]
MIFLQLFIEFFKIGLFSIGGGLATLPFLYELCDTRQWITLDDVSTMIALSESTPGPLGINMATYVGFKTAGLFGGVLATLGLVTPSIIIIIIVASVLNKFKQSKIVQGMFTWLRPASTALIAVAFISILTSTLFDHSIVLTVENYFNSLDYKSLIFGIILFFCIKKWDLHPFFYIIISAVVGILLQF